MEAECRQGRSGEVEGAEGGRCVCVWGGLGAQGGLGSKARGKTVWRFAVLLKLFRTKSE